MVFSFQPRIHESAHVFTPWTNRPFSPLSSRFVLTGFGALNRRSWRIINWRRIIESCLTEWRDFVDEKATVRLRREGKGREKVWREKKMEWMVTMRRWFIIYFYTAIAMINAGAWTMGVASTSKKRRYEHRRTKRRNSELRGWIFFSPRLIVIVPRGPLHCRPRDENVS